MITLTSAGPVVRRPLRAAALCLATVVGLPACTSAQTEIPEALKGPVEPVGKVPNATAKWKKTAVVEGLEHPWGVAFLPNGDMLITERPGRLRLVREGKLVKEPVAGVPEVLAVGQGGLLDISLHPDFAKNQLVYFTYSTGTEQANRTMLGRAKFDGTKLTDFQELLKVQPDKPQGQHFGSVLLWLEDGTFLMSVGDGGNPPLEVNGRLTRENGQDLSTHLGAVLRLDAEGKAPKDNPFVGREGARPEIYSYGHRNIQGMARDPESGRIWANEHGPFGGDELNLIKPGANYGWPVVTYGRDYKTKELISQKTTKEGMVDPKAVWIPTHAPSGLLVYTGDKFPDWRGRILSGALAPKEIRLIKLEGENVVGQENLPIGQRVRDIVQGPDGFIYVLTDQKEGQLLRIEPE